MTEVTDEMLDAAHAAIYAELGIGGPRSDRADYSRKVIYRAMRALEPAPYGAKDISIDPAHKNYGAAVVGAVERRKDGEDLWRHDGERQYRVTGRGWTSDRRRSTSTTPEPPKRREQSEPHYHRRYGDEEFGPPRRLVTYPHSRKTDT